MPVAVAGVRRVCAFQFSSVLTLRLLDVAVHARLLHTVLPPRWGAAGVHCLRVNFIHPAGLGHHPWRAAPQIVRASALGPAVAVVVHVPVARVVVTTRPSAGDRRGFLTRPDRAFAADVHSACVVISYYKLEVTPLLSPNVAALSAKCQHLALRQTNVPPIARIAQRLSNVQPHRTHLIRSGSYRAPRPVASNYVVYCRCRSSVAL